MTQLLISDTNLIENLDAAVLLLDSKGVVGRVNVSTETLFEQSRRYLLGKHFSELIPSESLAGFVEGCLSNSSQITLREMKIELPHKSIMADLTLSAVSEKANANGVLIEIGLINRLSKLIREQNQLERQQTFRLVIRGLAHEIKNPLGGIRGAAQLLQRELEGHGQRELTNILIKEADRLTRLVDRVMGSRQELKLKSESIHEVLDHVIELVGLPNEGHVSVLRDYDPTLPEIEFDREQMIQALLNIIINAKEVQKATREAQIGVITRFVRAVTINRRVYKRSLNIQIWDNGPGVPESIRETLFDPLITARPEGTGLGLSITQEILQRHHGTVQLETLDGKTCFSIYLPYGEADES